MSFFCPPLMSAAPDLRASRIRALQQTYSAQQQDLPVLEEQIRLLRDAVTDPGHSGELHVDSISLARHHYDLGVALHEHFMHLRDFKDLETAEAHLRIAICGSSLGVGLPEPASILGSVLYERARELRRTEMAEESVQLHRRSLSANSDMHPLQKARLSRELGRSLHVYQSMIKDGEEALSESVARLNDARNWYAEADVSDHLTLLALCESLCSLFRLKHEEPLLRDAFSCATLALRTISSSHRDFFWAIWMLARVQTGLAAFFREEEPLEQAIDTLRVLLADAPSVWRRILADRFGEALRLRFLTQGREEDLGELIECFTDILDGMTPNESHWDTLQWGLSIALSLRFSIAGLPEDIEAAARAADFAASVVKDNSVLLWDRLIQVAICRSEQFMAFGDEAHLEESTALLQQVVEQAPFRSLTWQVAARNLIAASSQRYEYTGNAVDLDKAIELIPPLIESPKGQSYYAPGDLGCAGEAFLLRFQARGVVEDLNQAVALLRRAVDATSIVSFRSNELFHEYAKTLRIHYEVLHDKESATRAFEIQKQLVDSLPDTHPDRAGVLCGLARLQLCTDPNQDGLAHVLVSLLDALKNSYCPAYKRLKEVSEILTYMVGSGMPCLDYKMIPQLCTVYSTAIALLPQVASFGLEPHVRLSVIGGAGSLTTQGAVHAISSRQPGLAVEMLESGRTVFWTQGLQLRTSFADLPEAMGDRLAKITYALARPIPDSASAGPTKDRELARRRQLGDDFKSVIDEARLIPGFEDLLRNLPFLALAKAAARNPIVVLVADGAVGHAIIVEEEVRCRLVTLQGVTAKVLEALAHRIEKQSRHARSSRGMRKVKVMEDQVADVYCELWTSIMHPIIEVLEWPVSSLSQVPYFLPKCHAEIGREAASPTSSVSDRCLHATSPSCRRHLCRRRSGVLLGLLRVVVHAVHRSASSRSEVGQATWSL
jgi:hypothetical protein